MFYRENRLNMLPTLLPSRFQPASVSITRNREGHYGVVFAVEVAHSKLRISAALLSEQAREREIVSVAAPQILQGGVSAMTVRPMAQFRCVSPERRDRRRYATDGVGVCNMFCWSAL
jgi:hypothetical protein